MTKIRKKCVNKKKLRAFSPEGVKEEEEEEQRWRITVPASWSVCLTPGRGNLGVPRSPPPGTRR